MAWPPHGRAGRCAWDRLRCPGLPGPRCLPPATPTERPRSPASRSLDRSRRRPWLECQFQGRARACHVLVPVRVATEGHRCGCGNESVGIIYRWGAEGGMSRLVGLPSTWQGAAQPRWDGLGGWRLGDQRLCLLYRHWLPQKRALCLWTDSRPSKEEEEDGKSEIQAGRNR
jgi:hypothetical protein